MKNIIKLLGIIALVAVIGFSMAACGEEEQEEDPWLTITGLGSFNNKFAVAFSVDIASGESAIIAAADVNIDNETVTCGKISGGNVKLKVWKTDSQGNPVSYTGNDSVDFYVIILKEETLNAAMFAGIDEDSIDENYDEILAEILGKIDGFGTLSVTFKKGVASGKFVRMLLPFFL